MNIPNRFKTPVIVGIALCIVVIIVVIVRSQMHTNNAPLPLTLSTSPTTIDLSNNQTIAGGIAPALQPDGNSALLFNTVTQHFIEIKKDKDYVATEYAVPLPSPVVGVQWSTTNTCALLTTDNTNQDAHPMIYHVGSSSITTLPVVQDRPYTISPDCSQIAYWEQIDATHVTLTLFSVESGKTTTVLDNYDSGNAWVRTYWPTADTLYVIRDRITGIPADGEDITELLSAVSNQIDDATLEQRQSRAFSVSISTKKITKRDDLNNIVTLSFSTGNGNWYAAHTIADDNNRLSLYSSDSNQPTIASLATDTIGNLSWQYNTGKMYLVASTGLSRDVYSAVSNSANFEKIGQIDLDEGTLIQSFVNLNNKLLLIEHNGTTTIAPIH